MFYTITQKRISILILYVFSLELCKKIFSAYNDGFEQSLEIGPDSVALTVTDLVQETTICSPEFLLAAWSLLMSQEQDLLMNHIARIPITPNQQVTMELNEVFSSVGAQDMDTSVSVDLDIFEFHWESFL